MKKFKPILILLFLLAPQLAWCGVTGKMSGKVIDKSTGEALPGATIILLDTKLGAITQVDGSYFVINIPPGTYNVQAAFIGYKTVRQSNVVINLDRTTKVDFELTSSDMQLGAVEVVAHAEGGIIKDLTTTSQQVSADLIKQMPVESMGDIISLQAGVTKDDGGGMHMRGGRGSEVSYIVDGMPVSSANVENNAIQQIEVISGTYNAEYGHAMSGIVNIVTKEGTQKYDGSITVKSGDFLTTNTDLFMNIGKIDPLTNHNIEANFGGPVPFLRNTTFFISGKYTNEENWLYGKRVHNPWDLCDFTSTDPSQWAVMSTGDNKIVPMNTNEGYTVQGKISTSLIDALKVTYNFSTSDNKSRGYDNGQKYNPDYSNYDKNKHYEHRLTFTNTLSNSTVQELRFLYSIDKWTNSHYADPYDPMYLLVINNDHNVPTDVYSVGGMNTGFGYERTISKAVKYDITSQIFKEHLVKFGIEVRERYRQREDFSVTRVGPNGVSGPLKVDTIGSFGHSYYDKKPLDVSAYLQDKIEIEDFIINAGLRWDYFDARSYVPTDMSNPQNIKDNKGVQRTFDEAFKSVSAKQQISPRLGLAFPISDEGSIHASYGEFFQIPDLGRLYENPFFNVLGNFSSFIGNADLEAERTTIFEIGLQQKLTDIILLNATCYYKDVRNLAGTKLYKTFDGDQYGQYVNYDYGSIYGITLSFDLMKVGMLSSNIDYTYQVAEGNGSDPKQAFYDAQGKSESTKILVPLAWDQTHVLNWVVNLAGDDWGASMISTFHSGNAFTPSLMENQQSNNQLLNTGRNKPDYNVDLRMYKNIKIFDGLDAQLFMYVENLLDRTKPENFPQLMQRDIDSHLRYDYLNTLYEARYNPGGQPKPRLVKVGLTLNF